MPTQENIELFKEFLVLSIIKEKGKIDSVKIIMDIMGIPELKSHEILISLMKKKQICYNINQGFELLEKSSDMKYYVFNSEGFDYVKMLERRIVEQVNKLYIPKNFLKKIK